jgi:hypothetical protein
MSQIPQVSEPRVRRILAAFRFRLLILINVHLCEGMAAAVCQLAFLVQRIDHRRIEAILLVVTGGGAGFEVAIGLRRFPARGADTCHVNSALAVC